MDATFDVDKCLGDADALVLQVDSCPPESEELAQTETAESADEHERSIARIYRIRELPELVRAEEAHLLVLDLRQRQLRNGVVGINRSSNAALMVLLRTCTTLWTVAGARSLPLGDPSRASHERNDVRSSLPSGVSANTGRMCDL